MDAAAMLLAERMDLGGEARVAADVHNEWCSGGVLCVVAQRTEHVRCTAQREGEDTIRRRRLKPADIGDGAPSRWAVHLRHYPQPRGRQD